LAKYRALYTILLIGTLVFALSYESKLTLVLFLGAAALPVVTLILMILSGVLLKLEVVPDADYVGKLQDFGIKVRVINRFIIPVSPMMIIGTFHDRSGSVIEGRRLVLSTGALHKSEYIFDGNIRWRGEYTLGIEHAEIFDLLRIFRFRIRKPPMCTVTVTPRRIVLDETTALCTDDYDSSITKVSFMESGTFASVRKYEDGDLMKHVHWKLTAKHDELMVKQSEQNLGSSALIITDIHAVSEDAESALMTADAAVEAALALTRKIITDGRTAVNIYRTKDGRTEVFSAAKTADYEKLLSIFSVLPITEAGKGTESLIPRAAEYLTGNEPLFIITTETDAKTFSEILRAIGSSVGEIRIYLTASKPDAALIAEVNAAKNASVWTIDPEDVSLSLRSSMETAI
jgi:uncharacterized protein (DUF58 family)